MAMQDVPALPSPPPRTYSAASLSEAELQTVAQLVSYLTENPYAYESHVQLVNILHKGFIDHVYPPNEPSSRSDPQTYNLLRDLLQAVEAMDARFTLGEGLWLDRLQVMKLLANTLEECIGVMEAYKKAVTEEAGSSKLWVSYGDWMLSLHNMANHGGSYPVQLEEDMRNMAMWSEEDRLVAAEVFNKTQILELWRQGSEETQYRINDSHLIWDRYTELLLQDLSQSPSREGVASLKKHLSDRLEIPHAKWEETFQMFSTFISTYDNLSWEQTMVSVKRQSARAKKAFEAREAFENKLQMAIDSGDKAVEWSTMTEYLEWERTEGKRLKIFSFNLSNALYQRALLRFASDTDLWEDYLMFSIDEEHGRRNITTLPILQRACRHCPWSGTLWSQYLQEAERKNQAFVDIGEIKHKATSTGLLDAGGMEEVLKVHSAWCGYLRRWAFQRYSTDEEMDVAEVGIRSAIEDMETLGRQKYGKEYQGDPEYRLERIYIKYLSQSLNWQGARDTWKGLIARHGNSYEFWLRYYNWEMITWSKLSHVNNTSPDEVPHEATKALREAVKRTTMDWPEKIMEVLMRHCEDHENVAELQHALNQTRKAKKAVAKRREIEALEAAELAEQQQQQQQAEAGADSKAASSNAKRKRDAIEGPDDETSAKKSRPSIIESKEPGVEEPSNSAPALLKRDRENSTIIIKNLPTHTTETKVRQYFRDVGIPILQIMSRDG